MSDTSTKYIRAPKLFWQTRRLDGHRNWPFAFWRELFQNSVDAKARRVSIEVREAPRTGAFGRDPAAGSIIRVVFADDGTGMTRDVIENVFLEPGRSTKTSGDTVGGFGTARTLLCFSQDRYEIHTNGLVVEGDGSEYMVQSVAEARQRAANSPQFLERIARFEGERGCAFVIDIDPKETDYAWRNVGMFKLLNELRHFVAMSDIRLDAISLNGESLIGDLKKGPARTRLSTDGLPEFATVHTSQTDKARFKGKVIVRVKGLAMFAADTGADNAQVLVELDPARTKALLTDSRDDLKDGPDFTLRSFVRDLATNQREALRDRSDEKEYTVPGELGDVRAEPEPLENVNFRRLGGEPAEDAPNTRGAPFVPESTSVSQTPEAVSPPAAPRTDAMPNLHDVHIHVEGIRGNTALENAARRWNPKYWRMAGQSLAGRGRESHEILAAWTAACTHALGVIGTLRPQLLRGSSHIPFVPGFVIAGLRENPDGTTSRLGGIHKKLADGRSAVLLNPVFDDGGTAYSIRQLRDGDGKFGLQRLVHTAIHEACHVLTNSHNEEFASLLTEVSSTLDYRKVSESILEQVNAVRTLYGAKEARIQALAELAGLQPMVAPMDDERPRAPLGARKLRPAARGLGVAYPTGTSVLGVMTAPENSALAADAAKAALEACIEKRQEEDQAAVHVAILAKIDEELSHAARQGWEPSSVDWEGFDQDASGAVAPDAGAATPNTVASDATPSSLDVDLGALELDMSSLSQRIVETSARLDADLGDIPLDPVPTPPPQDLGSAPSIGTPASSPDNREDEDDLGIIPIDRIHLGP